MDEGSVNEIADNLKVLSDPARLRILKELMGVKQEKHGCVRDLAESREYTSGTRIETARERLQLLAAQVDELATGKGAPFSFPTLLFSFQQNGLRL